MRVHAECIYHFMVGSFYQGTRVNIKLKSVIEAADAIGLLCYLASAVTFLAIS